jgi:hypothetical protein
VFAQVRDRAGNWSKTGSDTIALRNGAVASYSSAVLADSPAGYWRLGEKTGTTAGDSAGTNPGTYRNGVALDVPSLLTSDPGNSAAGFNGVNNHVGIPDAVAVSPTAALSLEAWIKPDVVPAAGSFASVATKEGSYSMQFNGPRLEFTIIQSGVRLRCQAPAGAVVAGQTYHAVGTYDGSFIRLYLNGAQVATLAASGPATVSSAPLTIGAWSATEEFMKGTIDEVALYGGALPGARVQAHYAAGSGAPASPLPAPSDLKAQAAAGRVDLSWTDNSSNETEFVIQRDTDPGFPAPTIVTVPANTTAYADTGLPTGVRYHYRVAARNATATSAWSNIASATTPEPVLAPSGLTATAASQTRVDLQWLDNSTNEAEFVIQRDTSAAFAAPTTVTVAANTTRYADTTVVASTTYYYRVRARNTADASPWSNTATVTTPDPPPPPPPPPPGTTYADTVRADAPVSWWRLGETSGTAAADERAANPGTYVNSPALGSPSLLGSDPGNASATFDGSVSHVLVRDAASLKLVAPFSLEAWIKPGAIPAVGSFASVMTKEGSYSIQFNGPRLEFTVIQSGVRKRLRAAAGAVVAGQTYHVVATYDGTNRHLYVNGADAATGALTGDPTVSSEALMIATWDGRAEFYKGTIDEVAVYKTALPAARVAAHWNAGK